MRSRRCARGSARSRRAASPRRRRSPTCARAGGASRRREPPPMRRGRAQDEKLAAIQKAMNELDEAAQGCWAAAATERFDIEGELTRDDRHRRRARAKATIVAATRRATRSSPRASSQLLGRYRWAPPLLRPDDPAAVQVQRARRAERHRSPARRRGTAQGKRRRSRCCSTRTTPATARFDVRGRDRARRHDGHARSPSAPSSGTSSATGAIESRRQADARTVAAGDMMYVPAGGAREVDRRRPDVHAVVVMVPGRPRRHGARRCAADAALDASGKPAVARCSCRRARRRRIGPATIFLEPAIVKDAPLAASILHAAGGREGPRARPREGDRAALHARGRRHDDDRRRRRRGHADLGRSRSRRTRSTRSPRPPPCARSRSTRPPAPSSGSRSSAMTSTSQPILARRHPRRARASCATSTIAAPTRSTR